MTKNLYLFVGPSGAGKTTVQDELCKRFSYKEVVSYTTRQPRHPGETGRKFISREEFEQLGELAEHVEYNGNLYGTTMKQLKECDLHIVELDGAKKIKALETKLGRKVKVVVIWVPEREAIARMVYRGDANETIQQRALADAAFRGGLWDLWDFWVYNQDLEKTVNLVQKYIEEQEKDNTHEKLTQADVNEVMDKAEQLGM